jgi:hypothetical protein
VSFGERFLAWPALFPARLAGESWGGAALTLRLGGARFGVSGLSELQRRLALARFEGFASESGAPAVDSRVFRVAASEFRALDTRGWDYDLDLEAGATSVKVAGISFMARIEWRPGLSGALWTSSEADAFPGVLENYLRVLAAYRFLEDGAALIHSAGLVDAGEAWLFVGVSGAGKTTLARLSVAEGRAVLSDDLNVLVPGASGPQALPLPFAGELRGSGLDRAFPVRGVVRLKKGGAHALAPLGRAAAIATLAACAPYVNRDPFRARRLLGNLETLLATPETHELSFASRPGIWETLAQRPVAIGRLA